VRTALRLPSDHDTAQQRLFIGALITGELVMLDPEERRRHLYVIGQTGTGKSTLLLNLIRQDLVAGEGLALLDPHGDLAESALAQVPKARTDDLVYINPADTEWPIGFNPLAQVPDDLKPVVADGMVSAFRHVWPDSWGQRLDYILTNAVRALLDVPGATLLMLPRLLIDDRFRSHVIAHHVGDPVVRAFWLTEYAAYGPTFRTEAISPIQNKVGKVLIEPRLRNMLAQPKSTITLRRLIDEGAIVICNLSKGGLGESTGHLLGALLTTAFAQAALSRADLSAADRRPFHLYADEFRGARFLALAPDGAPGRALTEWEWVHPGLSGPAVQRRITRRDAGETAWNYRRPRESWTESAHGGRCTALCPGEFHGICARRALVSRRLSGRRLQGRPAIWQDRRRQEDPGHPAHQPGDVMPVQPAAIRRVPCSSLELGDAEVESEDHQERAEDGGPEDDLGPQHDVAAQCGEIKPMRNGAEPAPEPFCGGRRKWHTSHDRRLAPPHISAVGDLPVSPLNGSASPRPRGLVGCGRS
jgi:hypothetical protein